MAITITPQISGQIASAICSYCYLFEPFRVEILESSLTAQKVYIDVQPFNTGNGIPETTLTKYAEFDINPGNAISVDLMKIARQIHDAGVYRFGTIDDLVGGNSWKATIASYRFKFLVYSDANATPVEIYKLPLNGGRQLEQFTAGVDQNQPINEFQYYGLDEAALKTRWPGTSIPEITLVSPTLGGGVRPTTNKIVNAGTPPCGGYLIWKSRFGGWMWWGFDFQTKSYSQKYSGNLEVDLFEAVDVGGASHPCVPADYSNIETSYRLTLKALGLTAEELKAVSGIHASPAIYYVYPNTEQIELMRLGSFSAPISSLADGGDFSVSLSSISKSSQMTI